MFGADWLAHIIIDHIQKKQDQHRSFATVMPTL